MLGLLPFPDISPEIFSITVFGVTLALRWYALAYIVGILLGWRLCLRAARNLSLWPANKPVMNAEEIDDLLTWIIFGVIIGGRLGSVLFYNPAYYYANPGEIVQVWDGGMSFHGGALGVILAAFIFTYRRGLSRIQAGDLIALGIPPGLFLGRIANFINAELWGRPTDLPWGVAFPTEAAQYCPDVIGICARHPSQLYEAALEGLLLGAVLIWLVWRRAAFKRPGTVMGTFFAGYGIARFVVEFLRQPDAQFVDQNNPLGLVWHINGLGLTMGQILSIPMIAVGVYFLLRARRS